MQIVAMPSVVRVLVFDIDLTLYDETPGSVTQASMLIKRLAQHTGESVEETAQEVAAMRAAYARENGGRDLSTSTIFMRLGISLEQIVRWREELFHPEEYASHDAQLVEAMDKLAARFQIAAVTNNTTRIGKRTLEVLGVDGYFPIVIGMDIAGESKPTLVPFRMVSEHYGVPFEEMISIGDRLAVDIELPVAHGMGGIVVSSVKDVYTLPGILPGA